MTQVLKYSGTQVLSDHPMAQVLRYSGTQVLNDHPMAEELRYSGTQVLSDHSINDSGTEAPLGTNYNMLSIR